MKIALKRPSPELVDKCLLSSWGFLSLCGLITVPFFLFVAHFFLQLRDLKEVNGRIQSLQRNALHKEAQLKKDEKVLEQIKHANHNYLQKTLESMVFLGSERQKWQAFSQQMEPGHPMKEKVSFLYQGNNKLQFVQTDLRKSKFFQETEENQTQPVEMSEEDLKELLCFIEGAQIHPHHPKEDAPQMILKTFELEKHTFLSEADKTFNVKMQLIKREAPTKL